MEKKLEVNPVERGLLDAAFEQLSRAEMIMEQAAVMRRNASQHISDVAESIRPELAKKPYQVRYHHIGAHFTILTPDEPAKKRAKNK